MTSALAQQHPPDDERRLDEDLARVVRAAGRAPIGAAGAVTGGTAAIIGIDLKYSGQPTPLAYVAASLLALFVSLALAVIGFRLRRDTQAWAADQQQVRQKLERLPVLERENAELRARVAEFEAANARRDRPLLRSFLLAATGSRSWAKYQERAADPRPRRDVGRTGFHMIVMNAIDSDVFPVVETEVRRPPPRPFRASRAEVETIGTRPASPPPDVDNRLLAVCGLGTLLAVLLFVHGEELVSFLAR
jgi:hypothetical protein